MTAHARLGPSNHRWPNCPGSVREEANYPDIPGEAAIDGTGSHLLLELCLDNNVPAAHYDGQIIGANHADSPYGWLVDPDRISRVQMCLDYVSRRVNELKEQCPGCAVIVEAESKSDPGTTFGRDDWWGTVDITILCVDNAHRCLFLEVIDYKDGRGWVHAKDNTQLVSYIGGKMIPFVNAGGVSNCRMTIVQPKTTPPVRYQCSTRPEDGLSANSIANTLVDLSNAAKATDDPDAPCRSGKWCQWCKANPKRGGHCVTATEKSIDTVKSMTTNTELITTDMPAFEYMSKAISDPKSLTSEQLSELLSARDALMSAFDSCEAEVKSRIELGENVPGYAMKPGRTTRKWNEDEDVIVKKLKARRLKLEDIYPKKLISVAQLLKSDKLTGVQKKKIEAELVSDVAGKLTLKKVAHNVAQSTTDELDSVEKMFGDVPAAQQEVIEQDTTDNSTITFL